MKLLKALSYVFEFVLDKIKKKSVLSVILSHSTTRIGYKQPANCRVKNPEHIYVCYMSRGEKQCYNLVFKCFLFYNFSALKHSDTKDKIRLGNSPRFFSCISLFTLATAFQTEVALQAESGEKKAFWQIIEGWYIWHSYLKSSLWGKATWAGGFPILLQTQVKQIKIGQNTYTMHIYLH